MRYRDKAGAIRGTGTSTPRLPNPLYDEQYDGSRPRIRLTLPSSTEQPPLTGSSNTTLQSWTISCSPDRHWPDVRRTFSKRGDTGSSIPQIYLVAGFGTSSSPSIPFNSSSPNGIGSTTASVENGNTTSTASDYTTISIQVRNIQPPPAEKGKGEWEL